MSFPVAIVVNSFVSRGRVGGRGQTFALERLGIEPWFVPTVVLPFHPGHGTATRVETADADFAGVVDDLIARGLEGVSTLLTGYLGSTAQMPHLLRLIEAVRKANPDVTICCDPVIGDANGLYVNEALALSILENLVPAADILTPNRFELSWLTGHPVTTNTQILEAVAALQAPGVLVTSAHAMMRGNMANLLVSGSRAWLAEASAIDHPPHGTGDLMAALFAGGIAHGMELDAALSRATAAVHDVLAFTGPGAEEIALVAGQDRLTGPRVPVSLRTLAMVRA
ncbi:pyridoxal kinase [Tepidamorphus sp. 3E244]|uniref:pyridoxal kinase n=1 Tax=Tepidamorphus sp. 3E244 TaxID=3385498 RepID=UPI0038FC7E2D